MKDLLPLHMPGARRPLTRLLLWSAADSTPTLLSGLCVATAIDQGFLRHRVGVGLAWLSLVALAYAVSAAAQPHIARHVAELVEPLRDRLVQRTVASALQSTGSTDLSTGNRAAARIMTQAENVRMLTGDTLLTMRQQAFSVAGVLFGLAVLSPVLMAPVAVCTVVAIGLLIGQVRALTRIHREAAVAGEELSTETRAVLMALRDVLACGATALAAAQVGAAIDHQAAAVRAIGRTGTVRAVVIAVGGYLPLALLLLTAPWLRTAAGLTTGGLVGAATYLFSSLVPLLRSLAQTVSSTLVPLFVNLHRIQETPPPLDTIPTGRETVPTRPVLETEGLGFAYGPTRAVVSGLSLAVPFGQHIALVGPSGTGKSTLGRLLAGLLPPDSGTVRLDGRPLGGFEWHSLRTSVNLVPQQGYLFTGSVRANLAYHRDGVTDAELEGAVRAVGAESLVDRLGGLDAHLAPAQLSAGERQILVLTRAFLANAVVTILDEATCHLDPAAEARAEEAFSRREGTLVVIAHRISSALRAEVTMVMDHTRVQVGTHEELLRSSARYAALVGHWSETEELVG
ncbi:ABC transporter ATP-binding protein/permease [Actinacidiphila glaucinigra]|uniref:ATP-binding cassette domain-containing protein n=1 Tax=Actinacidiphila glaucinigra TaxID=235986 RepID=UPI003869D8F6